jgi:membrane protein implicated in regulation of membrane protease activity
MSNRMRIAILIYAMVQAVVFGAGVILVLATPLAQTAMALMPWVIGLLLLISAPIAWLLAPMAQPRHARDLNKRDPTRSFEM